MNKNTVLGLLLIFGILILWSVLNKPSKEEQEAMKRKQDSLQQIAQQNEQQRINDSISFAQSQTQTQIPQEDIQGTKLLKDSIAKIVSQLKDSLNVIENQAKLGMFSNASKPNDKHFIIENELYKIKISSKGGRISSVLLKNFQTYDTLPLILFEENASTFGFTFNTINRLNITTDSMYFQPFWEDSKFEGKDSISIKGNDSLKFAMRLYPNTTEALYDKNSYVEFLYTLKGNNNMMGFDINFVGLDEIIAPNTNYLVLNWKADLLTQEKSVSRVSGPTVYYKYFEEDVDYLSETKDDEESLKSQIKWVAFKQQFFNSALIASSSFLSANVKTFTKENPQERYLRSMEAEFEIPYNYGIDQSFPMKYYFGPNKYNILKKYNLDLERQIPLGWSFFLMQWINRFAVIPVFNFLETFNLNYGIIILILTVLLKIVLFPIAYKTYKSSAKMRVLKPQVDEITAKFPKKEDSMKKQQATMALYKKAGVNPMAGCVPMLLQFPILIALFRFFPASIELRQQSFLWATDLSSYDSILDLGFSIPFYGDHVSLFTLLMTVSTIFYTKINNQMMASSQQMPGMKLMMYMMPIMFLGIFNNYASGLSYYYFLANVITFGQMFFIKRFIDEKALLKKIQEHQKKPAKKSNFSKRLESMQKKAATKQKGKR